MSGVANNLGQEYWRPPVQPAENGPGLRAQVEACHRCGTEFVLGARFCHVCGAGRDPQPQYPESRWRRYLDLQALRDRLGLSTSALVAFVLGIVCVLAAIITGLMFTASTVLDWQAVQVWRIEWLLAAVTAFVAAILLKRPVS